MKTLYKTLALLLLLCAISTAQLTPGAVYNPPARSILQQFQAFQWGPSLYTDSVQGAYFVEMGTTGPFSSDWGAFQPTGGQPHFLFFPVPIYDSWITVYYYATPGHVPGVDPWDGIRVTKFTGTGTGAYILPGLGNQGQLSSITPTFTVVRRNSDPYTVSAGTSGPGSTEIQPATNYSTTNFTLLFAVPYASDKPITYVRTTQGGTVFDYQFNNPTGQASSLSTIDAEIATFANDDYNGLQTITPTLYAPLFSQAVGKAGNTASHSPSEYAAEGGGYRYTFHLDNRKLTMVGVGDTTREMSSNDKPDGWIAKGYVWLAGPKAEGSADAKFSFVTDWRPGLVPLILRGQQERGSGLLDHSQVRYTIGPAFAPDLDRAGILALVKTWATDYGFKFLQPLVDDPTMSLNDLKPGEAPLEQQVVETLRAVLQ